MTNDQFAKNPVRKKFLPSSVKMVFLKKYSADTVFTLMKSGTITPQTLVEYLKMRTPFLFDTDVKGAELYRTDDGRRHLEKTHDGEIDDLFFTYGYYFSPGKHTKE